MVLVAVATFAHATDAPTDIRLYVLDCGRIDARDMGMFDDSGTLDGKPGTMSVPCFLIRHPKGILLWETGWAMPLPTARTVSTSPPASMAACGSSWSTSSRHWT